MIDLNSLFKKLISIATNTLKHYYVGEDLNHMGLTNIKASYYCPPKTARKEEKPTKEQNFMRTSYL